MKYNVRRKVAQIINAVNFFKSPLFIKKFIIFFHLFLFVGGQLLYNIVVVFAIHWHESAMDLHVFPSRSPLLPPSPSQPRCPSADEWIRKLWYIYTMEYYSAIKKNSFEKKKNSFESVLMRWMKLEPIIQSEVSQKDKDQYSILTHIYGI